MLRNWVLIPKWNYLATALYVDLPKHGKRFISSFALSWAPSSSCGTAFQKKHVILTFQLNTFKKDRKSKSRLDQNFGNFYFFTVSHLWHTIKIRSNFLCDSSLHRNKRFLISEDVFCKSSWKLVQNEKNYSFNTKILKFL